ncbi:unnamed protein product, partial [Musa hybrid cultivar]
LPSSPLKNGFRRFCYLRRSQEGEVVEAETTTGAVPFRLQLDKPIPFKNGIPRRYARRGHRGLHDRNPCIDQDRSSQRTPRSSCLISSGRGFGLSSSPRCELCHGFLEFVISSHELEL